MRYTPVHIGDTATFTPNIPADGSYDVFAWWNCYDRTGYQCNGYRGSQWRDLTGYCFHESASHAGYDTLNLVSVVSGYLWVLMIFWLVRLEVSPFPAMLRAQGISTVADAVRFVETGGASIAGIEIYNAHYYTQEWTDTNDDGVEDPDELTAYLVNFNSGTREVYHINDLNGNDIIDDMGELVLYGTELPESIRPVHL